MKTGAGDRSGFCFVGERALLLPQGRATPPLHYSHKAYTNPSRAAGHHNYQFSIIHSPLFCGAAAKGPAGGNLRQGQCGFSMGRYIRPQWVGVSERDARRLPRPAGRRDRKRDCVRGKGMGCFRQSCGCAGRPSGAHAPDSLCILRPRSAEPPP